jgi:hypothetical protein
MGGGPPAGAQRVDVPDDNSVLLMPTTIRTAAVTRWVGRGNGPSRVTGANACPAAGDCYKNNYPHRTLGAARLNTAQRRLSTAQRMTRRRISRIRSGFTARRAAKGATGCARLQLPMSSGSRMVRQTPAWDRTPPTWQFMAHGCFGHRTAGRFRRARRSPTVDDSQRRPSGSRTMHRLLLGHITNYRGESGARRKRCHRDSGLSLWVFFIRWSPPPEKKQRHGLRAYLPEVQPRTRRIRHWHWARGTVRTTYWHFNAFHASLPGNHGYAAVRHGWGTTAHRWSAAELLLRGSVPYGMTYQAWTRNTRTGLSQQLRSLLSVGYHAGEPSRL